MDIAAKKLAFIEDYLRLNNEHLVDKLSYLLNKEKNKSGRKKKTILDFYGVMGEAEGVDFKKIVEKGCENIDY